MRSVRFIATLWLLFLSQQSISSTNNAGIVLCSAERPPPPKEAPPDPPQENDQQQLSSSSTRTTSLLSTVTTACGAGIVGGSLGQLMRHRLDMKLKVTIALGTTCFLVSLFSDLFSFGHNNSNIISPEHHQYQQPTLQKVHSDELSYDSDRIGSSISTEQEEGEANWWPGMKATNLKDDVSSSSQHNNDKKQRQSTKQYSTNQKADIRVDYKAPPKPKEEKKPFVNPLLFWKRAKVEPEPEPKNKPPAWTNVDKDLGYVEDW